MEQQLQVLVTNEELEFSPEELDFNVDEVLADIHTFFGKKHSAVLFNSTETAAINRFPLKVTPERLRINVGKTHLLHGVEDPKEKKLFRRRGVLAFRAVISLKPTLGQPTGNMTSGNLGNWSVELWELENKR